MTIVGLEGIGKQREESLESGEGEVVSLVTSQKRSKLASFHSIFKLFSSSIALGFEPIFLSAARMARHSFSAAWNSAAALAVASLMVAFGLLVRGCGTKGIPLCGTDQRSVRVQRARPHPGKT